MTEPRRVIGVIADSSVSDASDPEGRLRRPDAIVPLRIIVDGERLDPDLSEEHVAAEIATAQASKTRVTTSRPSAGDFSAAYRELAAHGFTAIVVVVISSKLSGAFDSAQLAADESPVPVAVVDSTTAGWAMARVVDAVVRAVEGCHAESSAAALQDNLHEVVTRTLEGWACRVSLPNLTALKAGGRAPAAAAGIVRALGLRPVLTFAGGQFRHVELARSEQASYERALKGLGWVKGASEQADVPLVLETFGVPESRARRLLDACGYDGPVMTTSLPLALAVHLGAGSVSFSRWTSAAHSSTGEGPATA